RRVNDAGELRAPPRVPPSQRQPCVLAGDPRQGPSPAGRRRTGERGFPSMDFAQARRNMVDCQLRTFDVSDIPLLDAFEARPLERGHAAGAPYAAILVNGLIEVSPRGLLDQLADGGRLACIERVGRAGRAMLYVRSGEAFGSRSIFDAGAPVLPAFKAEPGFV